MTISFLGDVFLDKKYKINVKLNDFIFNLEYPLSLSGIPAKNKINLGVENPNIKETFEKLPIAVNLANNHIMDYGEKAFLKTIEYLDENNIKFFGAGNEKNNHSNPYILNWKNKKIALLGYSCPSTHAVFGSGTSNGSAILNIKKIIKDIENCKNKVDMIVVNLHWGDEEIKHPKATDIQKAHQIIDAGADLIIGHHAHVIQSIEKYNEKYIFYGIGNFIFPDFDVPSNYDGKKFQGRSNKIQQLLNKQTIIVNMDENLNVTYKTASFENGTIINKKITIPKWIPKNQRQYNIYVLYAKRIGTIKRFLKNPRLPKLNQIKIFFGFN